MVGLFIAAALVMAAAILPSLILGGRARMLREERGRHDVGHRDAELRHPMTHQATRPDAPR